MAESFNCGYWTSRATFQPLAAAPHPHPVDTWPSGSRDLGGRATSSRALAGLRLLTCEGTVLGAARGDEVEGHVGGPADVLVREGPVGAGVALAHHTLAFKKILSKVSMGNAVS